MYILNNALLAITALMALKQHHERHKKKEAN